MVKRFNELAINPELDLMLVLGDADDRAPAARFTLQADLEHVVAVERKRMLRRQATARREWQILAGSHVRLLEAQEYL